MIPANPSDEDDFAARLAAYDAALARDTSANPDPTPDPELRGAMQCLARLAAIWPRGVRPPTVTPADTRAETGPGQLGRFRIVRELGRGGGVVYLADDPMLHRRVALKVPRPESLFTPELRRRFVREAEAAARLDHRHIVPVHEAGEAGGICYLVSAYCHGPNLSTWMRSQSRPVPARRAALIVAALADGVAHMHDRGILHRDIKPTNVMLAPDERTDPANELGFMPRLTDFGLAKIDATPQAAPGDADRLAESDLPARTELTRSGAILGTPAYMAPEQAQGRSDRIGPAADFYALGVVLYELLVGRPPFRAESDVTTLQQIVADEPRGLRRQRRDVPRDLETVCLKCLAKEPARRYASAAELASDLRAVLAGGPIQARPTRLTEHAARKVRRHPVTALLATGCFLAALGSCAAVWWYGETQRREALARYRLQYLKDIPDAARALGKRDPATALKLLNGLRPPPGQPDQRGFEWHYLFGRLRDDGFVLGGHANTIKAVAFSPDGRTLASASRDATIGVWDAGTGELRHVLRGHGDMVNAVAFSPDGRTLASGSDDRTVKLWDTVSRRERVTLPDHGGPVTYIDFSPDGRLLATGGPDATSRVWTADTLQGRTYDTRAHNRIETAAFSRDGRDLVTGQQYPLLIWDPVTVQGTRIASKESGEFSTRRLTFSADGGLLATAQSDAYVRLRTASEQWPVRATLHSSGQTLQGLAFSARGRTLAVGADTLPNNKGGFVQLWDVPGSEEEVRRVGPDFALGVGPVGHATAWGVALDPAGNICVAGYFNGTVDLDPGPGRRLFQSEGLRDAFIAKFTGTGELIWARTLSGPGRDECSGLRVDAAGSLYLSGCFEGPAQFKPGPATASLTSPHGKVCGFVAKLDADGDAVWSRAFGGTGSAFASRLDRGLDGHLYVIGEFDGEVDFDLDRPGLLRRKAVKGRDIFVVKLDGNGCPVWVQTWGGEGLDRGLAMTLDAASNVYVAGGFSRTVDFGTPDAPRVLQAAGEVDAFIAKLDNLGHVLWAKALGGPGTDDARSLAVGPDGMVYVAGIFEQTADFDPGPEVRALTSAGNIDCFVVKLDRDGNHVWSRAIGGQQTDVVSYLTLDAAGDIWVTGRFDTATGRDDVDAFVACLDAAGNSLWTMSLGGPGRQSIAALGWDRRGGVLLAGTLSEGVVANHFGLPMTVRGVAHDEVFLARLPSVLPSRGPAWRHPTGEGLSGLAYSPDGSLALGDTAGLVHIWHPHREPPPPEPTHTPDEAWAVAFTPDGQTLVTGGDREKGKECLKVWDIATGSLRWASSGHRSLVSCVAVSPDGRAIASGGYDNTARLWDLKIGEERAVLRGHTAAVRCVAFSPDGRLLATGGRDRIVRLWDITTGHVVRLLEGHEDLVGGLAFSPDGRRLVTAAGDRTARVWAVATGELLSTLHDSSGLRCVAFAQDGKSVATGNKAGRVKFWDLSTGQDRAAAAGHQGELRTVAFSPDGRTLASAGDDKVIRLWDPATGTELLALPGHTAPVNGVAFSPAGDFLASAGHDGAVKVWRAPR